MTNLFNNAYDKCEARQKNTINNNEDNNKTEINYEKFFKKL